MGRSEWREKTLAQTTAFTSPDLPRPMSPDHPEPVTVGCDPEQKGSDEHRSNPRVGR